jgi:hypothetical protein
VPLQLWPKLRRRNGAALVSEPAGMAGQARNVKSVRGFGRVRIKAIGGPAQQRHGALFVTSLEMSQADRQLREASPEFPMGARSRLPYSLQDLVGVKGIALVDQPLGLAHGLVWAEHDVLGNPVDAGRPVGQWPSQGIPGAGVAGPTAAVPVTVIHPRMMTDLRRFPPRDGDTSEFAGLFFTPICLHVGVAR